METVELPAGLRWHPIRPLLGVRAIGVSAYSAGQAGETVVEPHDEASDGRGHEELYVVMTGAARFTLDGEELDAGPARSCSCGQASAAPPWRASRTRSCSPSAGRPRSSRPARSGSSWRARTSSRTRSERRRCSTGASRRSRTSAAIPFGYALLAAANDRFEEAAAELRVAVARDPRLRAEAEREPLLAAVMERLG